MIIGLTGLKGSGKDTVGKYLCDNYEFRQLSFAAKLKESAAANWPGLDPKLWDEWKNDSGITIEICSSNPEDGYAPIFSVTAREFLQNYGTEAHRNIFGDQFWVEAAMKEYDRNFDYVVTDVRFPNEGMVIAGAGGLIIAIDRGLSNEDGHVSESGLDAEMIDAIIPNYGDLESLYNAVDLFMEGFRLGKGR